MLNLNKNQEFKKYYLVCLIILSYLTLIPNTSFGFFGSKSKKEKITDNKPVVEPKLSISKEEQTCLDELQALDHDIDSDLFTDESQLELNNVSDFKFSCFKKNEVPSKPFLWMHFFIHPELKGIGHLFSETSDPYHNRINSFNFLKVYSEYLNNKNKIVKKNEKIIQRNQKACLANKPQKKLKSLPKIPSYELSYSAAKSGRTYRELIVKYNDTNIINFACRVSKFNISKGKKLSGEGTNYRSGALTKSETEKVVTQVHEEKFCASPDVEGYFEIDGNKVELSCKFEGSAPIENIREIFEF